MICQAVVVENYDKDNKGKIKVKLPLMEDGGDLLASTAVMQGYATKKGGFFFLPEKGDIVLVAFMGGGFERGVVIGSLYAGEGFPPKLTDEKNNNKTIASRSGAGLVFSDEDGKEKIIVKTPKGREILLDEENELISVKAKDGIDIKLNGKDGEISLAAKEKLSIACGKAKITLEKDGSIKIEGDSVSISGKSVKISGSDKTEVGGRTLSLKGNTEAKLSADTKLTVSASSAAEIKGGTVKING